MKSKFTLLFCSIFVLQSFATDYYVNPKTGNDGNSGTSESQAFKSANRISGLTLQPGDNVYLMDGDYPWTGGELFRINNSGTPDNYITIQNYPGHSPLLKFDGWTGIDITDGASYIALRGLRIQGTRSRITLEEALAQPGSCQNNKLGGPQGRFNGTGILVVGPNLRWSNSSSSQVPHHITIEDCEVFDCTSSGIALQQVDYVTVRNNKIHNNAWYTLYGTSGLNLYQFINTDGTTGVHNLIENNLFYENQLKVPQLPSCEFYDGNGLIVDDFNHVQTRNYKDPNITYPSYSATTLVRNNVAAENGGSGLHFYLSSNCNIYNNTVVNNAFQNDGDNGNAEIRVGLCKDFEIKNNIFLSESRVNEIDPNRNVDYSNNYHSGPEIDSVFALCTTCPKEGISFINTSISSESPYITASNSIQDLGIPLAEVPLDYLGNTRSDGKPDLGAYELDGCSETTWYVDADGDGIGADTDTVVACEQPEGYVATSGDLCDDNPDVTEPTTWYVDQDQDGIGSEDEVLSACEQPEGYVAIKGDFCDDNPDETEGVIWYEDQDGDGVGSNTSTRTACEQPRGFVAINGDFCDDNPEATEGSVWYADTDGDGVGVESESLEACSQPEGYVATFGDLCATDANKTEPGECGCNKIEGTCDTSTEACDAPAYSPTEIYSQSGTIVTYLGRAYQNKWHSEGQIPTDGGPWELIEICDGSGADCTSLNEWNSELIYDNKNTEVVYEGKVYKNQWYTKGDIPGENNVWELVDICTSVDTKLSSNSIQNGGTIGQIALYPTHFENQVVLKSNKGTVVKVFTTAGKLVFIDVTIATTTYITLSNVQSGMYLVHITSKENTIIERIVKK
ncbi:right-handed parallel beta-helix repeat-containing protein [Aquimarina sp. ERC-38]|uniref:T9SS type A sorting domain-containing protein n=1 Tax=Aquimarina sp. ERC-38 TaxID=2949996 RepID=UPI0022459A5D|nr:T9SS type A sorting domain-containing protein [Aquimarina sp. ERC-38]UZO79236.1 right-handed parallel beta-helix repeat-containing protein [Aquimarina sp. ERC-38]